MNTPKRVLVHNGGEYTSGRYGFGTRTRLVDKLTNQA